MRRAVVRYSPGRALPKEIGNVKEIVTYNLRKYAGRWSVTHLDAHETQTLKQVRVFFLLRCVCVCVCVCMFLR